MDLISGLGAASAADRLECLKQLKREVDTGGIELPARGSDVNNHIHTFYSFSPYSPAAAVWRACGSGLSTAGLMDHDCIAGAGEFTAAAEIMGMASTVGAECRVSMAGTPLDTRRINNPDQPGVAYVALHGVPHTQIERISSFFAPLRQARGERNRLMTGRLNEILAKYGIALDYDRDVLPLSYADRGGSVTERHLLFAVSRKITGRFGRGPAVTDFLLNEMKLVVPEKIQEYLNDAENPFYEYDLLGVLKSDLVERFYIPAGEECPPVRDVVALAEETGAILAYAYLGDVGSSVTGDKKTQTFEDSYLDELFDLIVELGFRAVTYMPSRNTREQLARLKALCEKHGLFQISGEDINTPRQKFICEAQRDPMFSNLEEAAWALIGHEKAATRRGEDGMFTPQTLARFPSLEERIVHFAAIGRGK